jgi:hypothetical protein
MYLIRYEIGNLGRPGAQVETFWSEIRYAEVDSSEPAVVEEKLQELRDHFDPKNSIHWMKFKGVYSIELAEFQCIPALNDIEE